MALDFCEKRVVKSVLMKKIGIGLAIAVLLIFSFPTQVNAGPIINPDWLKLKLLPGILTTPTLEPAVTPTI